MSMASRRPRAVPALRSSPSQGGAEQLDRGAERLRRAEAQANKIGSEAEGRIATFVTLDHTQSDVDKLEQTLVDLGGAVGDRPGLRDGTLPAVGELEPKRGARGSAFHCRMRRHQSLRPTPA